MKSFLCALTIVCFVAKTFAGELQDAAGRGEIEKVRSLVAANPTAINARVGGTTALHEAVRSGRLEVVKLLVEKNANVNATDFSGLTPLKLAIGYGRGEIAEFLRQHGGLEKAQAAVLVERAAIPPGANTTAV